ncbi:hypothetical protein GCM10012319_45620 [Comamonas sp. KCTC 72670]|nr:hypothetical protein GCM10012319_45620 [Comamonas sp. KCTC 72670]
MRGRRWRASFDANHGPEAHGRCPPGGADQHESGAREPGGCIGCPTPDERLPLPLRGLVTVASRRLFVVEPLAGSLTPVGAGVMDPARIAHSHECMALCGIDALAMSQIGGRLRPLP